MLNRSCARRLANRGQLRLAQSTVVPENANLDQFVRGKTSLDLLHDGIRETVFADNDDGFEPMGLRAKCAPLFWRDRKHGGEISSERGF